MKIEYSEYNLTINNGRVIVMLDYYDGKLVTGRIFDDDKVNLDKVFNLDIGKPIDPEDDNLTYKTESDKYLTITFTNNGNIYCITLNFSNGDLKIRKDTTTTSTYIKV